MASPKRKPHTPSPPPPLVDWRGYIPEHPGTKLLGAVAILTALGYMTGLLKPIIDSGPLPVAGRVELEDLHKDFEGHLTTIDKTLNDTLEVAKTANAQSQAALAQTNDYRLDRLLQQKIQLEEQIAKTPADAALKAALARTNIDIAKLTAAPSK